VSECAKLLRLPLVTKRTTVADRPPNLVQLRRRARCSESQLAERINSLAGADGHNTACNKNRISYWENGHCRPSPFYEYYYARALGVRADELVYPAPRHKSRRGDVRPDPPRSPAAEWLPTGMDSTGGPEVAEHEAVMAAAHESSEHAAAAESVSLGAATLEQFHDDVVRLARAYVRTPPFPVLREASRVRNRAYLLLSREQRPRQRRDLYLVAGQLCALLASASFDLGYPDGAAAQARAAWTYGMLAEHGELRAWAAGMQATVALWAGRPQEAIDRIDVGLASAPCGSPRVRLSCIQSRAWARIGSKADTEKALAACRTERERADGRNELHDHIGGEFGFTEARQAFCSGSAYLQLGNVGRALQECERAVRLYEASPAGERWYGAECSAHTDLAAARLLRGELEGAREALAPVFSLPPDKQVQGLVNGSARCSGCSASRSTSPRLRGDTWVNRSRGSLPAPSPVHCLVRPFRRPNSGPDRPAPPTEQAAGAPVRD
jgi:transcriptional regulator with XRE-family HTH domain